MDDLLHRLRHDMVELSSQGDNFTQQIWLMYGQFEQVVDRFHWPPVVTEKTGSIHHRSLRHSPIRHRRRHRRPRNNRTKMMNVVGSSTSFASDSESDSEMMDMPKMMGAGGSRQGVYSSRTASSSKGLNPLLDTISVIGDLCDSDDAIDGPSSATFYAGSNSVDSGYKSSCPTPDCLILAQDANNYISARTAAAPPPVLPKSRRTLPAVPPSAVDGSTRCPTVGGGAPLDLDHLTSLRRTLLTAIERYDTRTKELIDRELSSGMKSLDCDPIHPDADATDDDETGNERGLLCQTELKETQPEQDGATRFSRVAHCMLEIIEDLQRQQQQQQSTTSESCNVVAIDEVTQSVGVPVVPPKPARISMASTTTATPAPATPPRVARRGRRKLPTPTIPPSPPSSVDSAELTGADYHLYEEIIYDLGSSKTSIHSTIDSSSNVDQKKTIVCCPPPLPARPSRPLNVTTMGSCLSNSVKPWLNVIKPLRRDRNNQLIRNNNNNTTNSCSSLSSCCSSSSHWTSVANNKLNGHTDIARSNVYTFGNAQSHPAVIKPQAIHPPAGVINPSSLHHHHHHHRSSAHLHEDEYGFRAVSHMV